MQLVNYINDLISINNDLSAVLSENDNKMLESYLPTKHIKKIKSQFGMSVFSFEHVSTKKYNEHFITLLVKCIILLILTKNKSFDYNIILSQLDSKLQIDIINNVNTVIKKIDPSAPTVAPVAPTVAPVAPTGASSSAPTGASSGSSSPPPTGPSSPPPSSPPPTGPSFLDDLLYFESPFKTSDKCDPKKYLDKPKPAPEIICYQIIIPYYKENGVKYRSSIEGFPLLGVSLKFPNYLFNITSFNSSSQIYSMQVFPKNAVLPEIIQTAMEKPMWIQYYLSFLRNQKSSLELYSLAREYDMESKLKNDPNINIDIDYDKIKLDLTNSNSLGPKVSSFYSIEPVGLSSTSRIPSFGFGLGSGSDASKRPFNMNDLDFSSLESSKVPNTNLDFGKKKYLKYKQKYLSLKSKI